MKNKIIVIDNSLDITGAFNSIWYTVCNLKNEIDFVFVIPSASKLDVFLSNRNIKVYKLPFVELSRNWLRNLVYVFSLILNSYRLSRIVKEEDAGIVHSNDIYNLTGIFGKLFAKYSHFTHIRRLKTSFPEFLYNQWMRIHLRYSNEIIAVSNACVSETIMNRVKVIYDPLPLGENEPAYRVKDMGSEFKILYLANFTEGKGQQYAVESFPLVVQGSSARCVLTLVGGDFGLAKNKLFRQSLEALAVRLGVTENLVFLDRVEDVEKLIKEHDLVLNFSDSESFSYTCLEALYYGVPLVASDSGGPKELFENGISGILLRKREATEIAHSILRLADNASLRQQFSDAGKRYVRNKFSVQATSGKLLELYNSYPS